MAAVLAEVLDQADGMWWDEHETAAAVATDVEFPRDQLQLRIGLLRTMFAVFAMSQERALVGPLCFQRRATAVCCYHPVVLLLLLQLLRLLSHS